MTRTSCALMAAVLLGGGLARAHDLTATKTVDGQATIAISTYPTTLNFSFQVSNANPTTASTLLSADDPLLDAQGWLFTPGLPLTIDVGASVASAFSLSIDSFDQCLALGLLDTDPSTPGPIPNASFTNTFNIAWDSGSAQSSVRITCRPTNTLACDGTLYFASTGANGDGSGTTVAIMDPRTAALTPFATSSALAVSALGFDHMQGYLYGISNNPGKEHHLVRIGDDGAIVDLGPLPDLDRGARGAPFSAGTFLEDGTMLVATLTAAAGGPGYWARLEVVTRTVIDSGVIANGAEVDVRAWASNPVDGKVYAYDERSHRLATFDLMSGALADFGSAFPRDAAGMLVPFHARAAAFDANGHLLLYASDLGTGAHDVDTLYQVDVSHGALTRLGGPGPAGDGSFASCAFRRDARAITRDVGFFMTHEAALTACLGAGPIALGRLGTVAALPEALGVLWSTAAVDSSGIVLDERAAARLGLGRELISGTCNQRLFGAGSAYAELLADAARALDSDGAVAAALVSLSAANAAGAELRLPPLFDAGRATPTHALGLAHMPAPR